MNYLTIHGKSKFPGLYIWLRTGERKMVKVPPGCLLIQVSKQLEYVTGGYLEAGYHEVIVTEDTLKAAEAARARGDSTWRISSTLFAGFNYDRELRVWDQFRADVRIL